MPVKVSNDSWSQCGKGASQPHLYIQREEGGENVIITTTQRLESRGGEEGEERGGGFKSSHR